jgi:hypothetical protein
LIDEVVVAGRPATNANIPADDALVARASTEWVFASNQGQPRRIPDEVSRLFRAGIAAVTEAKVQGA